MERNDISQPLSFELLSWTFSIDVDWPNLLPHRHGDIDWIEFSESIGLICNVSTNETSLSIDSVKVSGVFLLIGIGSWLCCKLIKFYHTAFNNKSDPTSQGKSQGNFGNLFRTSYFGPSGAEHSQDTEDKQVPLHPIFQSDINVALPMVSRLNSIKCKSETCSCIMKASPVRCFHSANSSPIYHRSVYEQSFVGHTQETSSENISELSLEVDSSTFARLDQLQEEIDLIKSNCLSMDEEFVTIKCSRNLPGLSNLMESNELNQGHQTDECIQNAKKCFKGLYSLTTINQSISLDLADYQGNPTEQQKDFNKVQLSVEEETLPSLEWDELQDISDRSPSVASEQQSSYSISEMSCSDDNYIVNVEPKIDVIAYATSEWKGTSKKAENIRKGYTEAAFSLSLKHLHRIRGDNYCAIRATLFQILTQDIPVASGEQVYNRLCSGSGPNLTKEWHFVRLPYSNNIKEGIHLCLLQLDRLVAKLMDVEDKSSVLQNLLNCDAELDLQLNEAIKLMMLERTIHLYDCMEMGEQVPLFATLMFARTSCLNVTDFMSNHLCRVGDSGGLEMVEMYLLGYTLNVTIRVIRPSAFGTEDFICNYPDEVSTTLPQVTLIAEDDRHYNILVN